MRLIFAIALLLVAAGAASLWWEPSEAPTAPPPITSDTYTILEGDTLATIAARRWGNARLWSRIVEANPGLGEANSVTIGDTILLPDLERLAKAETEADALVAELDRGREARTVPSEAPSTTPTARPEDGLSIGLDRTIPRATVTASHIERTASGVLRIEHAFDLIGNGTEESPYQLSWPLLQTAGATYRPNLNERLLPQHIALLDGAFIEIEGYVAFPLPSDTSELIVMYNQWDGCCIGVPPTPFDAIEVKLTGPVAPGQRHTIKHGRVRGKLQVDPYLIENWLVGLYLMDDATVHLDE